MDAFQDGFVFIWSHKDVIREMVYGFEKAGLLYVENICLMLLDS